MGMVSILIMISFTLRSQILQQEISGEDGSKPASYIEDAERGLRDIPSGGVLLIPENDNDRVMAFDPETGNLLDANFIPSDPDNLATPIEVILSNNGNSLLVSDQLNDVVQEYDLDGNYLGLFAPASGVNTSILDNIRGISLRPNGNLLVTVGSGGNAGNLAEFDADGNYLGVFFDGTTGNMSSPFDVFLREGTDYLVSAITDDKIKSVGLNGSFIGDFAPADNFPEQIAATASGNVLVGMFSGAQEGVLELTGTGSLVGVYSPASLGNFRGVYELPGGNILATTNDGVYEIDRMGNIVDTKISGISCRFISYIPGPAEPSEIPLSPYMILVAVGLIALFTIYRYRRIA